MKLYLSAGFALFLSFLLIFQSTNQIIPVTQALNAYTATQDFFDVNLDSEYQNTTTYEGDITIGNTTVYEISNCEFNLTGRLTITDEALVRIKNAKILLTCLSDRWNWVPEETPFDGYNAFMIIVEKQAKLEVDNVTFVLSAPRLDPEIPRVFGVPYHGIYAKDFTEAHINNSKLLYANGLGDAIFATNSSRIYVTNSDLSTHRYIEQLKTMEQTPGSGIVSNDNSTVYVENCLLDVNYFADNSTVTLMNVNITDCFSYDPSPIINVTNARIEQIRVFCPANVYLNYVVADELYARVNCSVWATKCTFGIVSASFGANVWLFDTKAQKISGNVWIVYNLPLFGRITISYVYVPYIVPLIVITIIIVTLVSVYLIARRKTRKPVSLEEDQRSL
jgi:hypothetical protein